MYLISWTFREKYLNSELYCGDKWKVSWVLTVTDKGGLVELQCKKTIGIRALIRHLMAVMFNLRVNLSIIVIFDFVAFRHRSKQFFLLSQANVQEIASKNAQVCGKSIFSIYTGLHVNISTTSSFGHGEQNVP